jgi:chaperone required for assembly of F1-ATPase
MKFLIAAFVLALLGTASASIGFAVWDGRFHHEAALRAIHYDTNYDLSATRRMPVEPRN